MIWFVVVLGAGGLGLLCGRIGTRAHPPAAVSEETLPPSQTWLERHQRLRDQSQLASRQARVRDSRQVVHQHTLQLHLSPHFMFNALSSVQWLWSEGQHRKASHLFGNFVTLWRQHWRSDEASTHSLQEELDSLKAYLTLEQQRLGRKVQLDIRTEDKVPLHGHLPILLLQPALENALWHGMKDGIREPKVDLRIFASGKTNAQRTWVDIVMQDNGVGLSGSSTTTSTDAPSGHQSAGTALTVMRLKEVHPDARFELGASEAPWRTKVRISLPLVRPNS